MSRSNRRDLLEVVLGVVIAILVVGGVLVLAVVGRLPDWLP